MALPINVEDLLRQTKVESNRIEFKKGWNPDNICSRSSTIEAKGYMLDELQEMANRIPSDDRGIQLVGPTTR